jgi:serine/threonine protein kinase
MRFLDEYDSLGVLGQGSTGQVHVARPLRDPATTVVVKILRRELVGSPQARQLFDREARLTSRLRHPYIVRTLDFGIDPKAGPCLVMEFVPGQTLGQLLEKEKRLGIQRAGWLVGCLCHALEAAHTAGVTHRDLKPANLMVVSAGGPQEHLKVADFGLAQMTTKPFLSREKFEGSAFVHTQGTPAYISPEQLRGDDVDGRADLYTAGVILFEVLAGQLPFPEASLDELVEAHLRRPPPRFADLGVRDVPAAVEGVVRHCLAKFAPERPASARVLCAELGRALGRDLWAETTPVHELRTEASVPLAEDVPADEPGGPNVIVRQAEAWMPDRIAVIKLGGFLAEAGGRLTETRPGLLRAKFAPTESPGFFGRLFGRTGGDGIELDLSLEKPNPAEARLTVTAAFRVPGSRAPKNPEAWTKRCLLIFEEMKRYLMAS